ncbi:antitoxin [Actinomycetospora sp. CA-101289]|uniref:antitoxin n=1 Tax=Actinomycetospora sp. CA-101289 TaxID=3239893 RepID=UPI003D96AFB8
MDFGSMADKAKDWAGKNPDKADSFVEKGEDFADSRFGGHEGQVDQAGQKAKDYLHGGQEQPGEQAPPPPPPPGEEPPPQQ